MKKSFIISSLITGLLTTGFSASTMAGPNYANKHRYANEFSHQGQFESRKPSMKRIMRGFSRLDLSDEQREEIKAIFKQGFEDSKLKREEIQTLREQVKVLKHAEVVDEQALRATAISIANLRTDMMLSNLQNRKKVEGLLSDTQLEKLQKMKEKRQQRRAAK